MPRVVRSDLLQKLESCQPGLSPRGILQQSSCFVFRGGWVATFNGEVCCRIKSGLSADFVGAVAAEKLLELLRRMPEDELRFDGSADRVTLTGKNRRGWVRMESEIQLPTEQVEKPETWVTLPPEFGDAVAIVEECTGTDVSKEILTSVHIHPKWLEASDDVRLTRYKIKTGVTRPSLVRNSAIRHLATLGVTEVSETEKWLHFRNPSGLIYSCQRYAEAYPDLTKHLDVQDASPLTLPAGIQPASETAEVFSKEDADDGRITIRLRDGRMLLQGQGPTGGYEQVLKVRYDGKPIAFRIGPKLLAQIAEKNPECSVTQNRLKVDGGRWVYVTTLGQPPVADDTTTRHEEGTDE